MTHRFKWREVDTDDYDVSPVQCMECKSLFNHPGTLNFCPCCGIKFVGRLDCRCDSPRWYHDRPWLGLRYRQYVEIYPAWKVQLLVDGEWFDWSHIQNCPAIEAYRQRVEEYPGPEYRVTLVTGDENYFY